MRKLAITILCFHAAFGQEIEIVSERLKVTGISNPFTVEQVVIYEKSVGAGGGLGVRGKVRNSNKATFFHLLILAKITRVAAPRLKFEYLLTEFPPKTTSNLLRT